VAPPTTNSLHPHVHCVVTGGGVSDHGNDWYPARNGFLVPAKALAKLIRGKLKALFAKRRPDLVVPKAAWDKPWVVHAPAGARRTCCAISPAMYSASPSPTAALLASTTTATIRHKHRNSRSMPVATLALHQQGLGTRTPVGVAVFQTLGAR
jgi:hypothetical protein